MEEKKKLHEPKRQKLGNCSCVFFWRGEEGIQKEPTMETFERKYSLQSKGP